MKDINDEFLTAMAEYAVGEQSEANGWATLLKCVHNGCGLHNAHEVKGFLKQEEELFKEAGNVLPSAYRSAKSTIISALKNGVSVSIDMGKSAVYLATKAAKEASEIDKPEDKVGDVITSATKLVKLMRNLSNEEKEVVLRSGALCDLSVELDR